MNRKSLWVIALLVLGCGLAAAQTFGFESPSGELYCNYEQIGQYSGAVWQGTDNLSPCDSQPNATMVGIRGGLTKSGNPLGYAVKGVAFADNIYDAFTGAYSGAQWFVVTDLKCSAKHYGWIGFSSLSGFVVATNYGYLSCAIPGRDATPTKGLTIGNAKPQARQ